MNDRVQQHGVRLASDSYTEHTEAEASQALGVTAPLRCAMAVFVLMIKREGWKNVL